MAFECKKDCGFCCTPVPIKDIIINKNHEKQQRPVVKLLKVSEDEYLPLTRDKKCIYLDENNQCLIYNDRPEICREFGLNKKYPCPFLKPSGEKRSEAKSKQLYKNYKRNVERMYTQVTR